MRLHALPLFAALALLVQGGGGEEKTPQRPAAGQPGPAFRLNDHTGRALAIPLGEEGRWTVLAFFPKAATPG